MYIVSRHIGEGLNIYFQNFLGQKVEIFHLSIYLKWFHCAPASRKLNPALASNVLHHTPVSKF